MNSYNDDDDDEDLENKSKDIISEGSDQKSLNSIDELYGDNDPNINVCDCCSSEELCKEIKTLPKPKFNIYNLLDEFIKPEILSDQNKWFSPYANKYVDANNRTLIWEAPKILIILLKRFEFSYTGGAKKINYLIDFPIENFKYREVFTSK